MLYTLGLFLLPLRRPPLSRTIGGDFFVSLAIRLERGSEAVPLLLALILAPVFYLFISEQHPPLERVYPIHSMGRKNGGFM